MSGVAPAPVRLRPATAPPEARGLARDAVRLQEVGPRGAFTGVAGDLPDLLGPGDLLVANRSALRPAAIDAVVETPRAGAPLRIVLHLAHRYGPESWLVEPRRDAGTPGPLPLPVGSRLRAAHVSATLLGAFPGLPRLRFLRSDGDLAAVAERHGRPVRYGHLPIPVPRDAYETVFGDRAGSAEMASAGRPFTVDLVGALRARGVGIVLVTLHAGVSGLDAPEDPTYLRVPAEPFEVDAAAAHAVNQACADGRRVIAIGTGAVRALETAWDGRRVRPRRGWTRKVLRPGTSGRFLNGIVTGLHDPEASHLWLLRAILGERRVEQAYRAAAEADLLGHEFGDLQLIWREDGAP